ncbi:ABC transporter [Nocardioides sp. C4-1]|uniref:ABC transporter n=1 Tax=Nocardioides sp. C4-1 TaxID=3151851 RepID=UPI0032679DC2
MLPRPPGLTTAALVTVGLLAAVTACSPPPDDAAPASAESAGDHGEIAGAVELAEPALGLTTVDATGAVRHLDLLDESVTDLADLDPPGAVHTDGRFVFVQTTSGVEVVDSGVWTWDHVDHFHYYRAEARPVGRLDARGPATVVTTTSSTSGGSGVFLQRTGEAVMLDTGALADGELTERYRVNATPGAGLLVPVGEHALLAEGDRVTVLDADGVRGAEHPCPAAAGTIATRVGTVVGCRDGALLAVSGDDGPAIERVPYPDGPVPPATDFAGRDGRPTVAGLAGPRRVWLLDTRQRSWSLLRSPRPLVAVTAVDDDGEHVLGLTTDGRVLVLDGGSGDVVGLSEPLARASLRAGRGVPTLVADQQRAYLSAPVERRLHEIDFADGARVSRTFETPSEPLFVAGTGR